MIAVLINDRSSTVTAPEPRRHPSHSPEARRSTSDAVRWISVLRHLTVLGDVSRIAHHYMALKKGAMCLHVCLVRARSLYVIAAQLMLDGSRVGERVAA